MYSAHLSPEKSPSGYRLHLNKYLHCPESAFQGHSENCYILDSLNNHHSFSAGGKYFGFSDMEKELEYWVGKNGEKWY